MACQCFADGAVTREWSARRKTRLFSDLSSSTQTACIHSFVAVLPQTAESRAFAYCHFRLTPPLRVLFISLLHLLSTLRARACVYVRDAFCPNIHLYSSMQRSDITRRIGIRRVYLQSLEDVQRHRLESVNVSSLIAFSFHACSHTCAKLSRVNNATTEARATAPARRAHVGIVNSHAVACAHGFYADWNVHSLTVTLNCC